MPAPSSNASTPTLHRGTVLGPTPGDWTTLLRLVEKGDDLLFANDRLQHIPAQIPTVNGAVVL